MTSKKHVVARPVMGEVEDCVVSFVFSVGSQRTYEVLGTILTQLHRDNGAQLSIATMPIATMPIATESSSRTVDVNDNQNHRDEGRHRYKHFSHSIQSARSFPRGVSAWPLQRLETEMEARIPKFPG
jgi:hypothetical protein